MVRSKEEIINAITSMLGETPTDDGLAILEDVTDTITDFESRNQEDWRAKYEQNDRDWRKRYTERFSNKEPEQEPTPEPTPEEHTITSFEELFEIKED